MSDLSWLVINPLDNQEQARIMAEYVAQGYEVTKEEKDDGSAPSYWLCDNETSIEVVCHPLRRGSAQCHCVPDLITLTSLYDQFQQDGAIIHPISQIPEETSFTCFDQGGRWHTYIVIPELASALR